MNIIPWRKKHSIPVARESARSAPISEFRSEMDRLLDKFYRGSWLDPTGWSENFDWPTREFMPSIDVVENDKQITIRAELPGMDPLDIDINLSMSWLSHEGHAGAGDECNTRCSNSSPHTEQRYSKIGIAPLGGFSCQGFTVTARSS